MSSYTSKEKTVVIGNDIVPLIISHINYRGQQTIHETPDVVSLEVRTEKLSTLLLRLVG